jgi:hypothetical protein
MGVAKQGEGVHVVAVSRGFELRIATALSDRGVGISSRTCTTSNSSNVGRLRVHAGVKERHLLQNERESIRGVNESALLRAEVRGSMRRNMRRVDIASFRHHSDRGRKRKSKIKKQAAVKTASRTCA